MPKTKISEFSSTPANNTDIDSINIAEGCAPSGINDAIRELMAQLKDFQVGSAGDPVTVGGVLTVTAGAVGTPAITTAGDTNTGIFFPAADTIAFSEGGVEAMRIDSSGNVGIGTSSPGELLHLYKASGDPALRIQSSAGNCYVVNRAGTSAMDLLNSMNGPMTFATNNAERMRIDSSGNVGIGISSPGAKLDVSGTGPVIFRLNDTVTNYWQLESNSYLAFNRGGTERMRIDSSGNLLLGTLTGINNGTFNVKQSGSLDCINTAPAVAGTYIAARFCSSVGNTVGYISVSTSDVTYATSSDYRLKHDIQPMNGALAKVAALKPVTYKWNEDNRQSQGFIAHELQEVVPECVTGEKDAVETYTDADGNESTRPVYQGIDTSFLVATLTAAIQEQQALIQSLTDRITALEAA
jgi:hypothetical protein